MIIKEMIPSEYLLLSGPLFLFFQKLLFTKLKSSGGFVPREENDFILLETSQKVTIHSRTYWKSLKEFSFLFVLFLSLSIALFFLDRPQEANTCQPLLDLGKKKEWSHETMVRDGYLYRMERVPMILKGKREYIAKEGELYFSSIVLIRDDEGDVYMEKRWLREEELLNILRREEERCICPVFLGIYHSNISFIYSEKGWLILYEPVISRIGRDAVLVNKRIYYSEESRFNGFLQELHRRDLYRHYNEFTITFSSFSSEGKEERISLPIEGESAVCFTFCQNQQQEISFLS